MTKLTRTEAWQRVVKHHRLHMGKSTLLNMSAKRANYKIPSPRYEVEVVNDRRIAYYDREEFDQWVIEHYKPYAEQTYQKKRPRFVDFFGDG